MSKTATVRLRPKLSRRRNSGRMPGVIYLGSEWINQKVKVMPINSYKNLTAKLRKLQNILKRIERLIDEC